MFSSAEKTKPVTIQRQQQTAGSAFFRKAGEGNFFGSKENTSFFSPVIQAKLSVSSPDDPQEKEADAVADKVMRMPDPAVSVAPKEEDQKLQRKEEEEDKVQAKQQLPVILVQRKCDGCEKEEKAQRKVFRKIQRCEVELAAGQENDTGIQCKQISLYQSDILQQSGRGPPVTSLQPSFEQRLSSSKGSGNALPSGTQQFMGSRFNADFSGVRIHTGSYAENLSGSINAQAFAHGNDIYFNSGKYSPHTEAGGTLLAHELTHTIQQGASPVQNQPSVAPKVASKNIAQTSPETVDTSPQNNFPEPLQATRFNLRQVWEQQALLERNGANVKRKPIDNEHQQIPFVNRKEEGDNENETQQETMLQTKKEINAWYVDVQGALQTQPPVVQKMNDEKELQKKEDELRKEEDEFKTSPLNRLQKKSIDKFYASESEAAVNGFTFSSANTFQAKGIDGHQLAVSNENNIPQQINSVQERGPPLVQRWPGENNIHRSVIDDALDFVSGSSLAGCIGATEGTSVCLLRKARDVAMHIPGYRALRVVLGSDPITGENVQRNGHNFIEAAFDIMPGGLQLHQKLQEQGQLDAAAGWIDGRIGRLDNIVQSLTVRFTRFWNGLGVTDFLSPMDVIRDGAGIVLDFIGNVIDFAVETAGQLLDMVKTFLLNTLVDFIKEQTTAYPLLTVILGEDPITKQPVARNGTNILNALLELGGEEGIKQRTQMNDTGTFQRIAGYIDEGIAVFSGLYDAIIQNFEAIWSEIGIEALMSPIATFRRIYNIIAEPVDRVLDFVVRVGTEILALIKEVLMQRLSAWARTARGYALVTVIIGKDPFTDAEVPFTMENVIKGFFSLMEGGEEQYNQLKESGAIDRTVAKINAAVARLNMTPEGIVQLFTGLWNSFSIHDLVDPFAAFGRIIDTFGEPIGRLINFVIEIVKIVVEAILIVMNFPFDLVNNIIARAMAAMDRIQRDPVAFIKNLLRAIKQGFIQFFDNITTHLINGVVGWLMSELRDAGIPELTDFSLRGVIAWVLQVLGITMEKIWEKLAAHPRIGPQRVARIRSMINTLEGIWTFIKDVQERGMAAIWDKIQEQLSNLWNTIIDAVKNWITEQIINRVVARLLSMLDPTGIMAVVNSAIAIYSAIQSFIRYLREILEVVNSFVNGIADIAEGNVTTAANYLERTMGRAMPIVIGFLANQVGLSGIGRRVGEMIVSVREMVDQALTWLVNRAVDTGMALLDRAMAMGRSAVNTVLGWLGLRKEFQSADGESHSLSLHGNEDNADIYVASANPKLVPVFLTDITPIVNQSGNQAQRNALVSAVPISGRITTLVVNLRQRGNPNREAEKNRLELELNNLAPHLAVLMAVSNYPAPPQLIKPAFGNGTKAASFEVQYLRINSTSGGSAASSNSGTTLSGWSRLNQARLTAESAWVKMHLLTEQLGGPALDSNLVPARGQDTNLVFYRDVEQHAIADVSSNYVIWFKVTVQHNPTDQDYPNHIKMEYGPYDFNESSRQWEKKNSPSPAKNLNGVSASVGKVKEQNPALPDFSGNAGPKNINNMGWVDITNLNPQIMDRSFAEFVRAESQQAGQNGFNDENHLFTQLTSAYNIRRNRYPIDNFNVKLQVLRSALGSGLIIIQRRN